jgi:hypothetical protein
MRFSGLQKLSLVCDAQTVAHITCGSLGSLRLLNAEGSIFAPKILSKQKTRINPGIWFRPHKTRMALKYYISEGIKKTVILAFRVEIESHPCGEAFKPHYSALMRQVQI